MNRRTPVTITINYSQAETLARLARKQARKLQSRIDIEFIPEEGKRDRNVLGARRWMNLAKKIEDQIENL